MVQNVNVQAKGLRVAALALAASCSAPPPAPVSPPPPPVAAAPQEASPKIAIDPAPSLPSPSLPLTPPPEPPPPVVSPVGGPCVVPPGPKVRTDGDLTVTSPPRASTRSFGQRLRNQIDGSLSRGSARTWVGPEVPGFVFLTAGTRELFLLDPAPDGFVALYRDPYNASSCTLSGAGNSKNCSFGVAFFECGGRQRWLLLLDPLFSRPDHLEVQDVRYADGVVYFNEACQSYSKEAGGRCSSLVAVEPLTRTVIFRTQPLVSNNVFLVHQRYLITGYGFTSEPDALFIVRRSDGRVMDRIGIPTAHQGMSLDAEGVFTADLYSGGPLRFRAQGFDTDHPKLTRLPR